MSRRTYRGRHRAPSNTRRNLARAALVAVVGIAPLAVADLPAQADNPLDQIAQCESGGNIRATNPSSTASGKFQFLDSTWRSLGGTGRAKDASEATQDAMARKLYAQSGTTPWLASERCWGGKVRTAPARLVVPQRGAGGTYVVKNGDTLSSIAARSGEQWQELWRRNRDHVPDPHRIFPGQRIS